MTAETNTLLMKIAYEILKQPIGKKITQYSPFFQYSYKIFLQIYIDYYCFSFFFQLVVNYQPDLLMLWILLLEAKS